MLEGRTWAYLPRGPKSTRSGASVAPEAPLCCQGHVWRAPGVDVDHYLAPPMVPLLELSAAWQLTPAQGGVGHCNHSMSCLYFTVSDLSRQICVIRDEVVTGVARCTGQLTSDWYPELCTGSESFRGATCMKQPSERRA